MSTSPANMHDWEFERESARDAEIKDAISERIQDLEMSSGHGDDEQKLMERVLAKLFQSDIATETFHCYLFKLWQTRNAQDEEDKKKMARAAQIIANTIAPILRDIVSSDVRKEFDA
jgi:signal recognition particle GTPase